MMELTKYEQRQKDKNDMEKYKEVARKNLGLLYTIPDHGNVHLMVDGAFVEASIWIPKEAIE